MHAATDDLLKLSKPDRRRDIARRLRDILNMSLSGAHGVPQRLPEERALSIAYGVSRNGVREGLRLLAEENRIERNVGAGSFTRAIPSRHSSDRLLDFTNPAQDLPVQATADVIGFRLLTEIPVRLREVFGLSDLSTSLAVFERRSVHLGQLRGLHTYYLPLRNGETVTAADAAGDIYELIETRFGREVHSAIRAVSAVAADPSSAALLNAPVGAPLLFTESIVRASDGEVLLVNYARHRHDQLTLTFRAERGRPGNVANR
jgi:GntR family transcriptional regulator